jgi:phosphatidylserine/phosphatidylglycerophosphate/cardiolipin synthase-like enzyme
MLRGWQVRAAARCWRRIPARRTSSGITNTMITMRAKQMSTSSIQPYRRHRWAVAALLSAAETDLWPQMRSNRPRPAEVVAVYPHLAAVPSGAWLNLVKSAQHEIDLLDQQELPLVSDHDVVDALTERADAGIDVRICLGGSDSIDADERSALARYAPLRDYDEVSIRLHRGVLYHLIYRADDQLFVVQRAYGVGIAEAPVLHLERTDGGEMFATYAQSFELAWAEAEPEGASS